VSVCEWSSLPVGGDALVPRGNKSLDRLAAWSRFSEAPREEEHGREEGPSPFALTRCARGETTFVDGPVSGRRCLSHGRA